MNFIRRVSSILLLAILASPLSSAQSPNQQQKSVDLPEIEELRARVEANSAMPVDLRTRILENCDAAVGALKTASSNRRAAQDAILETASFEREIEALRRQLERPEAPPNLESLGALTVDQADDALDRERSRLAANRTALREKERLAEERATSRTNAARRHGELDQIIQTINDDLGAQGEIDRNPDLRAAIQFKLLSQREAARSEIEKIRATLSMFEESGSLIPLEIDLAQRRVAQSEELVGLLENTAFRLRQEEASSRLENVRVLSERIAAAAPEVTGIAKETADLAETLWGPDGVIAGSEQAAKKLTVLRKHLNELNRIADLTRRKFEAFGRRGSITRWWPKFPRDFPEPGEVARSIANLELQIPEIEHRLITYEQQRSRSQALSRSTLTEIQEARGGEIDPNLAADVRNLFQVRQDLLEEMLRLGGRYSTQLNELRTASLTFHERIGAVESFLYSNILWSRSVPKPTVPRVADIMQAFAWMVSPAHLPSLQVVGFEFRGIGISIAILLVILILLRGPIKRRLARISEKVADPETDSLRYTVETLILTIALAAPLPLALFEAGVVIGLLASNTYWSAIARALPFVATTAALLEVTRQLFAPRGLAEGHFGWPTLATQTLHRGLRWTEACGLPLLFVALLFVFSGIRLDSPADLQVYNNALGRLAFVAAMLVFGVSILAMLRPEKKTEVGKQDVRVPWPKRFAKYAFPAAFLGAYPLLLISTIVPAILAVFGFYVTALLLAYQMLRTLALILVILIAGGLIYRWRLVNRRHALLEMEAQDDAPRRLEALDSAEKQVRQLFRVSVMVVMSVGLWNIWSDALPMLQILRRVQILPHIELLAAEDEATTTFSQPADESGPGEEPAPTDSTSADSPQVEASVSTKSDSLTLWNLLKALFAGFFTVILVKNLPAVIEIVLRRRTTLDSGARFAVSTLIRYTVTIIGVVAVFGMLGISWSRVQWLAAALTFGLGFGLQEIVANFVSGLILLIERPIRVGDVVTIGTLMGRVTRIQIRATTITLWDRSEMIVPNKEFITTKLVNWTLSDSKRRIEIPLRIAYGADLEEVKTVLVDAAKDHPAVLSEPEPHALLLAFGDDSINVELRFVVDFGQGLSTKDAVQMAIESEFRKRRIEFALPQRQVRVVSAKDSPDQPTAGFGQADPEPAES